MSPSGAEAPLGPKPALLVLLLLLAGCGYVGDPEPPALKIPRPVSAFSVKQRADRIQIQFTLPRTTLEDMPLSSIGEIELRGGPDTGDAFDWIRWAAGARRIEAKAAGDAAVKVETGIEGWVGREVIFGVRVANTNGRFSSWSSPFVLQVVEPLAPPSTVKAEASRDGIRLTWQAPERAGQLFRVYRWAERDDALATAGEVAVPEWIDTSAVPGSRYEYSVQTVLKAANGEAESEPSRVISVLARDIAAPAQPVGLVAITGQATIELTWDRNTEPDLSAYRVYRAQDGGEFTLLAGDIDTPGYSDRAVEPGRRYAYAISAVDTAGNESARSEPAEAETR